MFLATAYIYVNDINASKEFYKKLLSEEPQFENEDRWVQFSNKIALYNRKYDEKIITKEPREKFNKAYIDEFAKDTGEKKNNIVVFNFCTDDLKTEHERLKSLKIGEVSDLMYVNVFTPYWYFNITDPDGNVIEITGSYNG
ncbi:MAG: VOC family protein [Ruminococcaceae bacterium]|nr:VOC family protein [Oscillospiraceae bacterium]